MAVAPLQRHQLFSDPPLRPEPNAESDVVVLGLELPPQGRVDFGDSQLHGEDRLLLDSDLGEVGIGG